MADYWETSANANGGDAATNAGPPAAGDAAMDDNILVSSYMADIAKYADKHCSEQYFESLGNGSLFTDK
jgi:hypothetical protein